MRITEGKIHSFAYELYILSNARQIQRELGMDFEVAKQEAAKALPKDRFVAGGNPEVFLNENGELKLSN